MSPAPAPMSAGSRETPGLGASGLMMFLVVLVLFFLGAGAAVAGIVTSIPLLIAGVLGIVVALFLARGLFILQPNEATVLVLFGSYRGTVRKPGWYWTNPLSQRTSVSLKVNNFTTPQLKVNDADGNPIEIAAVVVWRVVDTAKATFDVESYMHFVQVQSETAVRHLATKYPYDVGVHPDSHSLRGSSDEVSGALRRELQERLDLGGIEILDARLSHLAYSAEIAGAMLQRQQASAILAARQKIVEGAVGMVEDVIRTLEERGILHGMTPGDRAHMVSSLLVVLTSERGAQPVVQTAG